MADEDFTFSRPKPPSQVPLTANSTVRDAMTGAVSAIASTQGKNGETRQKVALAPGYSQLGWMMQCQRNKRLGKGNTPFNSAMSKAEVAEHKTVEDAWIIVRQKVYNLTPYLNYHPGGIPILEPVLGKDATLLFNKYHPWVNVDALLEACWLGVIEQ